MDELKIIRDYFPKSYNKFIKMYELIDSKDSKKLICNSDTELTNYIQTYTNGLNLKVNCVKSLQVEAFTFPYIPDSKPVSQLVTYPILNDLYIINTSYYKLLKADINGSISNGIITFTHKLPSGFVLETYQSSKFVKLLSNDIRARFAVTLHEIGHWYDVNPYLFESIFSIMNYVTTIILGGAILGSIVFGDLSDVPGLIAIIAITQVLFFFSINYIRSINEDNCDKFVKKLEYGEDFARFMFISEYGKRIPYSSIDKEKFLKHTSTFSFKIKNLVHRIMTGYSTHSKRIEASITENILNLSLEVELKNFIAPLDQLFAE